MNKKEFIEHFVITWIATWSANNWADYCGRDLHDELMSPPFEEAFFLAEEAWKNMYDRTKHSYFESEDKIKEYFGEE